MPGTLPPEPPSRLGDAVTVPRAALRDDGSIELGASAFLDELGPASDTSERRAQSLVGTLISGRYRADEILGQGGMGAVLGGEQIHLRKQVAIKLLHPDTERLPGLIERFEREGVAGAHVQHPNVAAAIDFGKLDDGSYFLVLEYVEGTPLSEVIDRGPLLPLRALRIARQMAEGLAAVHDKGIVHRDVKPQNTLLGQGDQVKIIDFGLAKVDIGTATGKKPARPAAQLTATGVVFGTPAYLAPEAALGMGAVDARSDLYALGVTLYEMLTGLQPFQGHDPASIFRQQRTEDPPTFQVRAPGVTVPAAAERIALRLVQKNPADRYQSAREVVLAIDEKHPRWGRERPQTPASCGGHPRAHPGGDGGSSGPRGSRRERRAGSRIRRRAAHAAVGPGNSHRHAGARRAGRGPPARPGARAARRRYRAPAPRRRRPLHRPPRPRRSRPSQRRRPSPRRRIWTSRGGARASTRPTRSRTGGSARTPSWRWPSWSPRCSTTPTPAPASSPWRRGSPTRVGAISPLRSSTRSPPDWAPAGSTCSTSWPSRAAARAVGNARAPPWRGPTSGSASRPRSASPSTSPSARA